jgi:6-phosphogluconolactonase
MMRHLLLVIVLIWTCHAGAQMPDPASPAGKETLVYIGTYTGEKSKGIYVFRLQSAGTEVFQNVTLVPLGLAAEALSPSHFEIDTQKRRLFTVNEIDQFNGKPTGAVSAFAIDLMGKLTLLNQRASMGPRPCQLALERQGRYLLVANCENGHTAVFPIGEDGRIGEPTDGVQHGGKETPCLAFDPSSRFVVICDRGSDKVLTYQFDAQTGKLTRAAPHPYASDGSGPRHVVFRQDGRFAYLVNEQRSTITVLSHDAGVLTPVQTISTLPEYFDGANVAGELHIHRSGKWLYASNVGHNSIVLFTIDAERGTLTFVEEQGTGGKTPRQFGIEPSSKHLAISNRDSDTVLASRIDEGNGRLKPSGIFADLASPAAIRFLPPQQ